MMVDQLAGPIVVAESRGLVRAGLVSLLTAWSGAAVSAAATLDAALAAVAGEDGAQLLLLDLDLLGEAGPRALQSVRQLHGGLRVIVLAGEDSRDAILACLGAGAHGFVARTAEFDELVRAIVAVRAGGIHVPHGAARPAIRAPAPPALTARQLEVLRLLAEGRSTKDIARTMDLAVSTIKVHLAGLYRSVGARNRVEAIRRSGVLGPTAQAA